jgi:nucleotide-binding universal stress UspA family protein
MYETILVGFDESPASKPAVIEASNWIRRHGGKLILVHAIFFETEEFSFAPDQQEKRVKVGEKACIQAKEMIAAEFGIEAEYLLCEGESTDVIIDVAMGKKADLIVLGTFGRKGLKRLLMGSVISDVIGKSPVDVLVVKKPCEKCTGEYGSLLVPFDGSEFSKRALVRACQLSKSDGSSITVLYVIPQYEEMVEFFKTESIRKSLSREAEKIIGAAAAIAASEGATVQKEIAEGHSADRIIETAIKNNRDLIIMGSHGHSGIDKVIIGSTAERVVANASCPILLVK